MGATHKMGLAAWFGALPASLVMGFVPAAAAAEPAVIHWQVVNVPLWERPGGSGQFGGYWNGTFDVVVSPESAEVRDLELQGFRSVSASGLPVADDGKGFSYYREWNYYCDENGCYPQTTESFGLAFADDITQWRDRIDVIGGGFDWTDCSRVMSCQQDYGYVGPGGYITQAIPEPATALLGALGLMTVALAVRRRSVGGTYPASTTKPLRPA